MLRRVAALAAIGLLPALPAAGAELITFPNVPRGALVFAPSSFTTLHYDWLGAFAPDGAVAARPADLRSYDLLSGTPEAGELIALVGPAELTDPPATPRHQEIAPSPFDF